MTEEETTISITRTAGYSAGLAQHLQSLRLQDKWTDVTLILNGRSFKCHGVLLAAASPVLGEQVKAGQCTIDGDLVTVEVLEKILDYIYTGKITMPSHLLMQTFITANCMKINELTKLCIEQIPDNLKPSNFMHWYRLSADLTLPKIHEYCMKFFAFHILDVFKEEECLNLDFKQVKAFFDSPVASCNNLVEANILWIRHDGENRDEHSKHLLKRDKLEKCRRTFIQKMLAKYFKRVEIEEKQPVCKKLLWAALHRCSNNKSEDLEIAIAGGTYNFTDINKSCSIMKTDRNELKEFAKLPKNLTPMYSICTAPDCLIVTGGIDSSLCAKYTLSSNTWSAPPDMPVDRWNHASVFFNGYVLTIAGLVFGFPSPRVDGLHLTSGQWKDGLTLPLAVITPQVASLDDSVYVLDGQSHKLFQLSAAGTKWLEKQSLPDNVYYEWLSMAAGDGRLYVVGRNGPDASQGLFAIYTSSTDTWQTALELPQNTHAWGALVFGQKLYLIGGFTTEIEEYDDESDSWAIIDLKLPKELCNHHAVVLDRQPS